VTGDGESVPVDRGPVPTVEPGSLGILGGTFDPIHIAHLALAEEAAEALGLERVVFVPAGVPPHKPGLDITAAEQRFAMVALAIAGNERFSVDRIEVDREGRSFTVDTLRALRERRESGGPNGELTVILSAEAFLGLMTWREPERVLELARMAVAPRDGYPTADPGFLATHMPRRPDLWGRAVFLDGPRLRLSASELRARAAAGRSLRYLVPDAVAGYIGDHGLYQHSRRTQRT
jgi:nicotinate-nucleotide adenylyltransferase